MNYINSKHSLHGFPFFRRLISFAQMDVHESTAQEQRNTNPRQVKAVAEVSRAQLPRVLKDFFIVQSVNEHGCEGVEA